LEVEQYNSQRNRHNLFTTIHPSAFKEVNPFLDSDPEFQHSSQTLLLDSESSEERARKRYKTHLADTVIVKAPAFLFAVNETIFNPQAMIPLMSNATALDRVIWVAPYRRTRSSSPVYQP